MFFSGTGCCLLVYVCVSYDIHAVVCSTVFYQFRGWRRWRRCRSILSQVYGPVSPTVTYKSSPRPIELVDPEVAVATMTGKASVIGPPAKEGSLTLPVKGWSMEHSKRW